MRICKLNATIENKKGGGGTFLPNCISILTNFTDILFLDLLDLNCYFKHT